LHEIESTGIFAFLIDVFCFYNVPLFLWGNIFIVLKHGFIYIKQIDLSDFIGWQTTKFRENPNLQSFANGVQFAG
jgi:hypothetical protein